MDFSLRLDGTQSRQLSLSLELERAELPKVEQAEFFMPVWTPGSYLVREYARQISGFRACDRDSGKPLAWHKSAKNRYRVEFPKGTGAIRIDYRVYAHDLSVRGSFADRDFAYWNGAAVLLWPLGLEDQPAEFRVELPEAWALHSGCSAEAQVGAAKLAFANLDEAVDTPCLAGRGLQELAFDSGDRAHRLLFCGFESIEVPEGFLSDCEAVVEESAAVFGGELPYPWYIFLCLFADRGRGGLEHANSSTLLAPRTTFAPASEYQDFLSLVAHEHFHVWNGKRMRPAELWELDYEQENCTELLWAVEGFTAYYDDYLCLRAGVMSRESYLKILAGHVSKMINMPGRLSQSLCEASFDAWIRFYRPDENSLNSTQNYYSNGALAALCLDARIRQESGGLSCLDDAMRSLYSQTYGKGRGYGMEDLVDCMSQAAGSDMSEFLSELVRGPFDPDLKAAFAGYGLDLRQSKNPTLQIGVQLQRAAPRIAKVFDGRPAQAAGIAPEDEILAIEDLRVTRDNYSDLFKQLAKAGEALRLLLSRRGKLFEVSVCPEPSPSAGYEIVALEGASEEATALGDSWLRSRKASPRGVVSAS
ncbi:MAG: M61 family metallopeptidase [Planctomycetota bacterium]|jgi:predicted metalloprotease with PDZ domain